MHDCTLTALLTSTMRTIPVFHLLIHAHIFSCTLQPLALLPPPFPSTSPLLMSIDALAVGKEHRRCGIATRLLQSVEVLGAWEYGLGCCNMAIRQESC